MNGRDVSFRALSQKPRDIQLLKHKSALCSHRLQTLFQKELLVAWADLEILDEMLHQMTVFTKLSANM